MTIYLIRHGLAAAGAEDLDPGLDPVGHAQAAATADMFRGKDIARLVVSPLRRTQETAAPIAEAVGVPSETRVEVAEVFDPTMPSDERRQMIGPFMASSWSVQPEHLRAWRQRVLDALLELAHETPGDLVVVSHYIAIGVVIGAALRDDRVVPVQIANCSITSLEAADGAFSLLEAASTQHLPGDLVTGLRTALPGGAQP